MSKLVTYGAVTLLIILALFATACSGTPATPVPTPEPSPTPEPEPTPPVTGSTNFRFLISDDVNAIEDFEHVYITISEIGVQRGGGSGNWTEFAPDVSVVDLKPLVGENAPEIWSGNLTPGEYTKVFIYVSEISGNLTPALGGEEADVKLPGEKLHISKPFTVTDNGTTSFVYDITVVKAGQSGKYILQPQIAQSGADKDFDEIKPENGKGEKPEKPGQPEEKEYRGTIETIDGTTWTVDIEGESWPVDVTGAEIEGEPEVGLQVEIEGIEKNGTIVASEIEVEEQETEEEALEDTVWELEEYGDTDNLTGVMEDTKITVEFISSDGTVKGSAGCNSYSGSYEAEGSQLSIPGPIAVTEMYCTEPEGLMDQEQEFLSILQLAESYQIDDDELRITCGSQSLVFESE